MFTRNRYSLAEVVKWTRHELVILTSYAALITFLIAELNLEIFRIPWTPIALIGTAVAFLIGFQNNSAYGRLWEARKIWGGIVNTSRTWGMKVKDMVRASDNSFNSDQVREVHKTIIYRHIAWLTSLRYAMRSPRPWEVNNAAKTNTEWVSRLHIPERETTLQTALTNYLSSKELDYVMSRNNKAAATLFLQSKHIRKLKDQGLIWEFAFLELENVLEKMFRLQGQSERIKNFPYPRQYTTICHLFIRVFLILLPLGLVPEFISVAQKAFPNGQGAHHLVVWSAVPFTALVSWIFHTMERIGRVGENPFEGGPNDVPISTISHGIEIDLRQLLNETSEQLPDPIREEASVQM